MNTLGTRSRRSPAVALVAAGLVAAGIGTVHAQAPDEGVISACFKSTDGRLRVIDTGDTCRANETLLQWNQQGEPGPKGDPGEQGIQGPAGPTGATGEKGDPGDSAYEVWLDQEGTEGSEQDFLDSFSVQWSNILGNPLGNDDGTPNESGDPVSWSRIKDLTTSSGDGVIGGSFLQDRTVTAADLADAAVRGGRDNGPGAVANNVQDGSITEHDLSSGALRTQSLAGVHVDVVTVDSAPGSPISVSVPPGTTGRFVLTVPGVEVYDFVSVSPPTDLQDGLVFGGASITSPGVVTVSLANVSGVAVTQGSPVVFTVSWMDLTP